MRRFAWRSTFGAAILLSPAMPGPCAAQSPPVPAPSPPSQSPPASGAPRSHVPPPRPFRMAAETPAPVLAASAPAATLRPSMRLPSQWQQPAPPPVQLPSESTVPSPALLEPGPGEFALNLKAAPLEPTDLQFPINLATALRLSDARPLIVAAAQASVWVAEAQLTRAKVLWVPQLNIGADYIRHDGGGPDFNKGILTAPSVNFFYGGGGLWEIVSLTDVFFEPLVKRQDLNSRQWDIQIRQERLHAPDRRRLFQRPSGTAACMPAPSTASSAGVTWSSESPA